MEGSLRQLRDNVRVGRPEATDEEVEDALRVLGLYERFAAFPDGIDTEVRERGSRLSAGERQLISLARAALADPALLILDEATSNLDPGTVNAIGKENSGTSMSGDIPWPRTTVSCATGVPRICWCTIGLRYLSVGGALGASFSS